jgi:hypothetical protein
MNRASTSMKQVARFLLRGLLLAAAYFLAPASAEANSTGLSWLDGHWRPDAQLCSGYLDDEDTVSFGVEAGLNLFIQFEKLRCPVQAGGDLSYRVAQAESCAKSGFPEMFIGEYKLIRVGDYVVRGYLAFTDSRGEVSIMKDCGALRWWGTQK